MLYMIQQWSSGLFGVIPYVEENGKIPLFDSKEETMQYIESKPDRFHNQVIEIKPINC